MAKRYELSNEAYVCRSLHRNPWPGAAPPDRPPDARALRGETCRNALAVINGVSTVSGLAKPGDIRSDAQAPAALNEAQTQASLTKTV